MSWVLIIGDFLVLMAFSGGGIAFHEVEGSVVAELIRIATPFLIGYFPLAFAFGALERPDSGKTFAGRSAAALYLGLGCGFVLRGIQRGSVPLGSFVGITLIFCTVLMLLYRGTYWWVTRPKAPS